MKSQTSPIHDRFALETLEDRRLLSGDVETIDLDVGAAPESVIFADFNGDEILDTAVLAPSIGEVQVWTPDGRGGMREWAVLEGEFSSAQRLQVLDVDGDGVVDLGFFEADTHRFSAYINRGDGTFEFGGGLQLADTATGVVFLYHGEGPAGEPVGPWIGPMFGGDDEGFGEEHDGEADDGTGEPHFQGDPFLLVWHESLGAVELVDSLLLMPDGGSSSDDGSDEASVVPWPFDGDYVDLPGGVYFEAGSGGDAVAISDFNHDGEFDLALTNRDDGTVTVAYFTRELERKMKEGYDPDTDGLAETETVEIGGEPVHINVFDANRDGWQDLLVSDAAEGNLAIAYGGPDGYTEVEWTLVGEGLTQAFINFNSFGRDLFVLGFGASGDVTELHFRDDGLEIHKVEEGFLLSSDEALPRQIVVGEFTGDGCIDIAAIDGAGGGVRVYVNVACDDHDDGHEDEYDGPPFDGADFPVPGVPDLLPEYDSGASDSDDITAYNNAGERYLKFRVDISHISDELADLKAEAEAYFEEHGEQFDDDGFQYLPEAWMNIYSGDVYIGTAQIDVSADSVVVRTDGFTVLREGMHKIRAGIVLGAPGLRGLLGTRSAVLEVEVRVPRVEVDTSGGDDGETATIRKDADGNAVLVLRREGGAGDEEINLGSFEGVPAITGSVVTMREGKSNGGASRYAAGQSDEGVVLFVRGTDGDWSGRNLTGEIAGSEAITDSNIEVLTTPWGNLNMAGLNEDGELVFYWQDGGLDGEGRFRWNFVNLADGQLRANGQDVPRFASSLESFVTPWGAMNVAGLDANGHLRVIWWAPKLSHWVSTDLTNLLGATPLVGDISAYMTPWGGINLIGLNADSEMVAVWWAPGHEWTVSPIGDMLGAPTFVSGSLTSFLSERGDIFVAGLTADGGVGFFSWDLSDFTWDYMKLGDISADPTLVGTVSGYHTRASGEVTLLAGSLEGDIYEFVGDPFGEEAWTVGLYDTDGDA